MSISSHSSQVQRLGRPSVRFKDCIDDSKKDTDYYMGVKSIVPVKPQEISKEEKTEDKKE